MSTDAVTWAMDEAPMLRTAKGKNDSTARHVLQALAEFAHEDGSNAFPSVAKLQHRTGYEERTVQKALRRLEDGGLITPTGTVYGCTRYQLHLHKLRPTSDWEDLIAKRDAQRATGAERVRRHRAKAVTPSEDVTHSDAVTPEPVEPPVTASDDVRNGLEERYVTHSDDVRNGARTPLTTKEPPWEPPGTETPPHGRRPPTGSRGTGGGGFAAADENSAPPSSRPPSGSPVAGHVLAGLPQPLREAIEAVGIRRLPPYVAEIVRTEVERGLTVARLIERATDRWHQRYADEPIGRPLGVVAALLANHCTSPRCDDGTDLDTGAACRTCERWREDQRAAAADRREQAEREEAERRRTAYREETAAAEAAALEEQRASGAAPEEPVAPVAPLTLVPAPRGRRNATPPRSAAGSVQPPLLTAIDGRPDDEEPPPYGWCPDCARPLLRPGQTVHSTCTPPDDEEREHDTA
ncbi:helix-turn-helix domain-containing protein [Streptomyces sp. DSM 42041]|uniref:Helix-turn-helix domain-containing protein n=1 Tax=Streptomyces hazeniae TaxID=3075538 RepID=A0ABU2NJY8_9ACTN|nr:helix-turn-helix domain-containing protein [Streptomyces sp. DSM 42041]MDT0377309.1 helix-turn-helix domain-containing protein [Streptomyces sp. DSM 42041]